MQKPPFTLGILIGLFVGFFLGPLLVFLYVNSGLMPVTTAEPPMPFEKFIVKTAMRAALKKEVDLKPSVEFKVTQLQSAAKSYVNHCAGCHGAIDTPDSKMAEAMFPKSPQLFKADDQVTDDPVGTIHWKIKNGIRLTGMPAFKDILSDEEIWAISTILQQADRLPDPVKNELVLSRQEKK